MGLERFQERLDSVAALRSVIGEPSTLVMKKVQSQLDEPMRDFLAESRFCLLATVDSAANCDVSPRGDAGPVATVLDDQTLALAERPGNRRADSLRNILETGRVGLLFLVVGEGETLRVNGRACLTQDTQVLDRFVERGKAPALAVGIEIEECYFQCAKALIRSSLWSNQGHDSAAGARRFAEILLQETQVEDESVDSLADKIAESYRDRLY